MMVVMSTGDTRHIAALDGVRGLAVIAVIVYHAVGGYGIALGGHLGVDVFFVLSGFLITRLLLVEYARTGRVSYRDFYIRRALRLGPALMLTIVLVASLAAVFPHVREKITVDLATAFGAVILYVNSWLNVPFPGSTGPLGHTWSLSVEEQFYLVWPPVLLFLLARGGRGLARRLLIGAGVLAVARALLAAADVAPGLEYAPTSRADGLLIGCAIAVVLHERPVRLSGWVGWAALGGLTAAVLVVPGHASGLLFGGFTVVAALAGLLVLAAVTGSSSALTRLLSLSPLTYTGRISYGLYLYHIPLFYLLRPLLSVPQFVLIGLASTAAIALLSYYTVERPALAMKARLAPRQPRRITDRNVNGSVAEPRTFAAAAPEKAHISM